MSTTSAPAMAPVTMAPAIANVTTTLAPVIVNQTVPTTSAPVWTPRPTPDEAFAYRAEGDSSFGYQWQDDYSMAHQHAFRRPGWSTWEPLTGLGPFCYRDTCYNVTDACNKFKGTSLHNSVCSFPENVKVAGPSCWRGACKAEGTGLCTSLGGETVGVADGVSGPQWCIFGGDRSMVGPLCYNNNCYTDEALTSCNELGGQIWNDDFCIVNGYYTVVGPVCWASSCLTGDLTLICVSELSGTVVAGNWCLVPGCDRTVIGPLCSAAPYDLSEQCFESAALDVCKKHNGIDVGDRFCVLPGTNWTLVGPTVYQAVETTGITYEFCRALAHNLVGYFNYMTTDAIAGRFCLVKERLPTTTPICNDTGCDNEEGKRFCDRFGGKLLGPGYMCSVTDSYRQVVGPLVWNGTRLPGNPKYCEGRFCAVPNRAEDLNVNLRCPTSAPVISRGGLLGAAPGNSTNSTGGTGNNNTGIGVDPSSGQSGGTRSRHVISGWVLSTLLVLAHVASTRAW